MTRFVVDHSTAGAIIGGTLRKDKYEGIIRYAAAGRPNVSITRREYNDLVTNGVQVAIVVEHEARWLLGTPTEVAARVTAARQVWRSAGVPDGVTWLACDFDVTNGGPTSPGSPGDQNMHHVAQSLHAAAQVVGAHNVGFYGSAYAIDWLVAHEPWITRYWDTEAWSHRRPPHPKAQLYQQARAVNIAGVSSDPNVVLGNDWGQREVIRPIPKPPAPKPKPRPPKPHPKVTIGALTGMIVTAIVALLHSQLGLKITPPEAATITTMVTLLVSYFYPKGSPQ